MQEIKSKGISFTVKTPNDIRKNILNGTHIYRCGLYGRSGQGKSRMADTFPGKKGVIDGDNGAVVYSGNCEVVSIQEDTVTKSPARAWEVAVEVLEYFSNKDDIDVIIIDSFTTLATALMKAIQKASGHVGQQPTLPEYGRLKELSKEFIFKCFGSGKHVVCIFHEQMEKNELSGQVWCNPLVTGKLSAEIPMYFDELYHMEPKKEGADKVKYYVLTKATALYTTKSRLDSVVPIPTIYEANYSKLFTYVENEVKKFLPRNIQSPTEFPLPPLPVSSPSQQKESNSTPKGMSAILGRRKKV